MRTSFLEEYERDLFPYLPWVKDQLEEKFQGLIEGKNLEIHFLNGRIKAPESLEKKLARPDRSYQNLTDVTDLIAFRVVTFSEDVIPQVARFVEKAFDVDFANSVNKLHQEDSQKFGYRSLHYVCSLPKPLQKKVPKHVRTIKFEVQIRTILQHAWAEIEHDVGYKVTEQLPREFRRRFSQVASLLEVADREFAAIRTDLKTYETKLKNSNFKDEQIDVDRISLSSLLKKKEIERLDQVVSRFLHSPLSDEIFYPEYILCVLHAAGLKRLGDILVSASKRERSLSHFLPVYFKFSNSQWRLDKESIFRVQKGYGLLFLAHLHLLDSEDLFLDKVNRLTQFYRDIDYPDDEESAKRAAQSLVKALKAGKLL